MQQKPEEHINHSHPTLQSFMYRDSMVISLPLRLLKTAHHKIVSEGCRQEEQFPKSENQRISKTLKAINIIQFVNISSKLNLNRYPISAIA